MLALYLVLREEEYSRNKKESFKWYLSGRHSRCVHRVLHVRVSILVAFHERVPLVYQLALVVLPLATTAML